MAPPLLQGSACPEKWRSGRTSSAGQDHPSRNEAPSMNSEMVTDRTGDRRLDEHVLTGAEGRQGDHQLGEVAQRRVEKTADRIPGLRGDLLSRAAEHCG